MGRTLEALNHIETAQPVCQAPAPKLPISDLSAEVPAIEEIEQEIPFIEVGPRKSMEASPAVLAFSPPSSKVTSSHPFRVAPAAVAQFPDAKPKGVSFRAFGADSRSLPAASSRFAPELITFHHPEHSLCEGYRSLLAEIQSKRMPGRSHVEVMATVEGEDAPTIVLLNVAILAARQAGARVVAIDANGMHPTTARLLSLSSCPGLSDVLSGSVALSNALQETGVANLVALTAGKANDEGGVRLVVEAMPVVLRQLRDQYSLVLIGASSKQDVTGIARHCDGVYLVTSQEKAETSGVVEFAHSIQQHGGKLGGYILTSA